MNPDVGSFCLHYSLPKNISPQGEQTTSLDNYFRLEFNMEANTMNPDQTALLGAV